MIKHLVLVIAVRVISEWLFAELRRQGHVAPNPSVTAFLLDALGRDPESLFGHGPLRIQLQTPT